jgi:hypothetical protein
MPHAVKSMGAGAHGPMNILPSWLAFIWTLVFLAIFVIHARHAHDSTGQRRFWHSGHVLMAFGMAFMYAPSSINHFDIPGGFWRFVFAAAMLLILAWVITEALARHAINVLWVVMAIDLGAMIYMWSPGGYDVSVSWVLVAYFAGQALLWATDMMRTVDRHRIPGGFSMTTGGAVATACAAPLVCYRDLRVSMCAMTLGMAYMLAAMQLLL